MTIALPKLSSNTTGGPIATRMSELWLVSGSRFCRASFQRCAAAARREARSDARPLRKYVMDCGNSYIQGETHAGFDQTDSVQPRVHLRGLGRVFCGDRRNVHCAGHLQYLHLRGAHCWRVRF